MNIYPALRLRMGSWTYYVVKMSMRELSDTVKFASEVYDDRTLDEAIQRILNESRAKKEIAEYLKRQPDRFFSSIVVAAIEGDPKFYAVEIEEEERFALLRDDRRLRDSFGVLSFDGTQKYYALDGQHRLKAIKTLLDRQDPLSDGAPEGFQNEEVSVIVVVPSAQDTHETFLQKYRRLFSHLNRYAKPTSMTENIIIDEDDAFAILTRRLITDHPFFRSPGRQAETTRIKTSKGKNLSEGDPYFTTIETLYTMNETLLTSAFRKNEGWGEAGGLKLKEFKRFRPSEEHLQKLFDELVLYWDGILKEIPDLRKDPVKMRVHTRHDQTEDDTSDHLLFWPIGQELLAGLARALLDRYLDDPRHPTSESVARALRGLGRLEWRLHEPPWRYFMLIGDASRSGGWRMRSEERKDAARLGYRIQLWAIGADELDEHDELELRDLWASMLVPSQPPDEVASMWRHVQKARDRLASQLRR